MFITDCFRFVEENVARAAVANMYAPVNDTDPLIDKIVAKIIEIANCILTAISDSYCNTVEFQSRFHQLSPEDASKIVNQLLLDQVDELHQPIPERNKYEFILRNLKIVYPFLTTYFARSKVPGNGLNKVVLSTKAQRLILTELEKKGSLNGMKVEVCDNIETFQSKLQQAFIHLENNSKVCFLLRHRRQSKPANMTSHTSMIYLQKTNDSFQFFVSDSGGRERHWTKHIVASIKKVIHEAGLDDLLKMFVYNGKKRQKDFTNCPIFALRDAVHMAQDPDHFMEWITERAELSEDANVFHLNDLPPRMMETCQSLKLVKEYQEQTQTKETLIYSRSKPEGKTLDQVIEKHTVVLQDDKTGIGKSRNAKVDNLFLKYERMIISNAILQGY